MPAEDELQPFARITLEGERFTHARLPVNALIEIQRYEALVVAAATNKWQAENPGIPLPADFSEGLGLIIDHIEEGSATPVLERAPSEYDSYYDSGRDDVESLFKAIIGDWTPADSTTDSLGTADAQLPPITDVPYQEVLIITELDAFQNFGTSLQEHEALRLPITAGDISNSGDSVEILRTTSANLFKPFSTTVRDAYSAEPPALVPRRREKSTVAGRLTGINADRKNFEIVTLVYGEIHGRYDGSAELTRDLKAVLDSSSQAPVVRITGRMSWDGDQLYRILGVDEIELLEIETEPWSRRIIELAGLSAGWDPDNPASALINFGAIDALRDILRSNEGFANSAGIFPRVDGGVILEWADPDYLVTVEISGSLEFSVFHLDAVTARAVEPEFANLLEVKEFLRGVLK